MLTKQIQMNSKSKSWIHLSVIRQSYLYQMVCTYKYTAQIQNNSIASESVERAYLPLPPSLQQGLHNTGNEMSCTLNGKKTCVEITLLNVLLVRDFSFIIVEHLVYQSTLCNATIMDTWTLFSLA